MKIAIIGSRGYPSTYGGYETLVRKLAPMLVQDGHSVTVFCRDSLGGRTRWKADGVDCRVTPGIERKATSTLTFGGSASAIAAFGGFDSALVLNIANGYWLPMLRAGGVATAVNTDGVEWERAKWGRTARNVFKGGAWASARWADRLIADSEEMGRIYRSRFGVDSTFIPYGADICSATGHERLEHLGLPTSGYALVVARLVPENNVDLVLDAIESLGPAAPHLIVVGESTYGSPIDARLTELSIHDRVTWVGHVDDQDLLHELWRNAGVVVHGHSVGGTNPALLQALGCGAPVIALDTPFNREVLRDDSMLFPHDRSKLAGMIEDVTRNPDRRRELRDHGLRCVSERYPWDSVLASYRDVLVELAAGKG